MKLTQNLKDRQLRVIQTLRKWSGYVVEVGQFAKGQNSFSWVSLKKNAKKSFVWKFFIKESEATSTSASLRWPRHWPPLKGWFRRLFCNCEFGNSITVIKKSIENINFTINTYNNIVQSLKLWISNDYQTCKLKIELALVNVSFFVKVE